MVVKLDVASAMHIERRIPKLDRHKEMFVGGNNQ